MKTEIMATGHDIRICKYDTTIHFITNDENVL